MPLKCCKSRLSPPSASPHMLVRGRLLDLIDEAVQRGKWLFTVTAPAGSGKTTLLAQYARHLTGRGDHMAWVTMDAQDTLSDYCAFVYLALEGVLAREASERLKVHEEPLTGKGIRNVVSDLIGTLEEIPHPLFLFVDDFHVGANPELIEGLLFLLKHRPANLFLLLGSRHRIPAPLARLRAEACLLEIDHRQLCFDAHEHASLLHALGGKFDSNAAAVLFEKTGGWPAPTHLAAQAASSQGDISEYLARLSARTDVLHEFIEAEVVEQLPQCERDLLAGTSICEHLSHELCAAITQDDALTRESFESMKSRLLLQPLDDVEHCFRLQPLVREAFQRRLEQKSPATLAGLHRRASHWYESAGQFTTALRHAAAASDNELIVRLLEEHGMAVLMHGQLAQYLQVFDSIPKEMLEQSREVLYHLGVISNLTFQADKTAQIVAKLNASLGEVETRDHKLAARIQALECGTCLIAQDFERARAICNANLRNVDDPAVDLPVRRAWHLVSGLVNFHHDQFERAIADLDDARRIDSGCAPRQGEHAYLALCNLELGRIATARTLVPRRPDSETAPCGCDSIDAVRLGLMGGVVAFYSGELRTAELWLSGLLPTVRRFPLLGISIPFAHALARTYQARGNSEAALAVVADCRAFASSHHVTRLEGAMAAEGVRIYLELGEYNRAQALHTEWLARRESLRPLMEKQSSGAIIDEYIQLSHARLTMCEQQHEAAQAMLEELNRRLRDTQCKRRQLEVLILLAKSYMESGNDEAAKHALGFALDLDQDRAMLQPFRDEGEPVLECLRGVLRDLKRAPPGRNRLLQQKFIRSILSTGNGGATIASPAAGEAPAAAMPELKSFGELTRREMETLRALTKGYSNKEICGRLFISLPTVKSHLRSAYGKLGVSCRAQAMKLLIESGFDAVRQ